MVRISRLLVAVAAAGLLVSGCTVKKTEQPPLTGPSELALSINLTANPDVVTQDGSSQSRIVILARDANGNPVKGVPLHADLFVNRQVLAAGHLSGTDVTTGSDGRATITYTAPPLPPDSSDEGIVVTISVIPTGTDFANAVSRSVNIRLVPPSVLTPGPVASFTFSPLSAVANIPISFDASASRPSEGGNIIAYLWDFGDQATGTGVKPQHVYRGTGNYPVTLLVLDDQGRTSYACTLTVGVGDATAPTADFTYSPSTVTPNQLIFFDASASKAAAGRTISDYTWKFGNGTTQHGVAVTASYATVGTYTVTLRGAG